MELYVFLRMSSDNIYVEELRVKDSKTKSYRFHVGSLDV